MTETVRQTTTVIVRPEVAIVHSSPVAKVTAIHSTAGVPGKNADSRWGNITGDLSQQTDLEAVLSTKQPHTDTLDSLESAAPGAGLLVSNGIRYFTTTSLDGGEF